MTQLILNWIPDRFTWKLCFLIEFLFILIHCNLARFKNNFRKLLKLLVWMVKFRIFNINLWVNVFKFSLYIIKIFIFLWIFLIFLILKIFKLTCSLHLLNGLFIGKAYRVKLFLLCDAIVACKKLLGIVKFCILLIWEMWRTYMIFLISLLHMIIWLIKYLINLHVWIYCIAW